MKAKIGPITKSVARLKNQFKMGQKSHSVSPALDQQCLFSSEKEKKAAKVLGGMGKGKHLAGKVHDNTYKAHCTVCRRTFSIGMLLMVGT